MAESNVGEVIFLKHVQKIAAAEKRKDDAVNALRTARKAAKTDGIVLADMDAARRLLKLAAGEVEGQFNNMVRYAKYLGAPVYSQFDLFSNDEDSVGRACREGTSAGRTGASEGTNPYDVTSPEGQAWLSNFRDEQNRLMKEFKDLDGRTIKEQQAAAKAAEKEAAKKAESAAEKSKRTKKPEPVH